jgi:hypothetical protein
MVEGGFTMTITPSPLAPAFVQVCDFAANQAVEGWRDAQGTQQIEQGWYHSGAGTVVTLPLPASGVERLRVEFIVRSDAAGSIGCGEPRAMLWAHLGESRFEIITHSASTLASAAARPPEHRTQYSLVFEFDRGDLQVQVDGAQVLRLTHPTLRVMAHGLTVNLGKNCCLGHLQIEGYHPLPSLPARTSPRRPLELEAVVDFADDLHYGAYTSAMFEQLFDEYQRWGLRRVHWMYNGGTRRGWWRNAHVGIWEHFQQTVQNIGGEILPHVVALARQRGIELYGLWKPFELGHMLCTAPPGSDAARTRGKLLRRGGWIYWIADVAQQRRDLMMCRKPGTFGLARTDPITRLELVKEDDRPIGFGTGDLQLFVSDDNASYRPYRGAVRVSQNVVDYPLWEHTPGGGRALDRRRRCRVISLDQLHITSPYVVIVAPGGKRSFANTLVNLLHVHGELGEDRLLTYGLKQRVPHLDYDIATATRSNGSGRDFLDVGIEFDVLPGTPSACLAGFDAIAQRHVLDSGDGILAFARGKDRDTAACMSPAFEQTRALWMGWVDDMLAYGVDGVDLRVRHHHSHLTWGEFGFETPVRDAFLDRHGVDIWTTDAFDPAALRRLRGEFYTQFYREVRQRLRQAQRPLRLHVSTTMDIEPQLGGAMNMHFDWRKWLDEGLADSITLKEIYPETSLADEVLAVARRHGVPVYFSPFGNTIWRSGRGAALLAERLDLAQRAGCDGFQLYESCSVIRPKNGRLEMVQPEARDIFRQYSGR